MCAGRAHARARSRTLHQFVMLAALTSVVSGSGCQSWCHWDDANCGKDECEPCPRCKELNGPPAGAPPLLQNGQIPPNDRLFEYSGYVHVSVNGEHASFDRQYSPSLMPRFAAAAEENPGTQIKWRTDAQRVTVKLDYVHQCDEKCPPDVNRGCYARNLCHCHCAVRIFLDGEQNEVYLRPRADGKYGPGNFDVVPMKYQPSATPHVYKLFLPWCAVVSFRGLTLESAADAPPTQLMELPPAPPRLRYAAWGDSITHGWCGNESYPGHIARINNWEAVNLGIQGLSLIDGLGNGIAAVGADLITLMIGANDCSMNGLGGFGSRMHELLRTIRAKQPQVVLAVVTPIEMACRLEPFRQALRDGVSDMLAADRGVVLIEGKGLVPKSDFIQGGNPHPNINGMREMGLNLNAELGYAKSLFQLLSCSPMRLQVMVTPGGAFTVFSGPSVDVGSRQATRISDADTCRPCCWRSFMVSPQRSFRGRADQSGQATVVLDGSCETTSWQVLDLSNCHLSRLGSHQAFNSTVRTAALALATHVPHGSRHSTPWASTPSKQVLQSAQSERTVFKKSPPPPPRVLPLADLKCYAARYKDLLDGFCAGAILQCKWAVLLEHWESAGSREGRTFGCKDEPTPPPHPYPPSPSLPLPSPLPMVNAAAIASLGGGESRMPVASPPHSPPMDLPSRRQQAFSTVLLPAIVVLTVAFIAVRFVVGLRQPATSLTASPPPPSRSKYSKAATTPHLARESGQNDSSGRHLFAIDDDDFD